MSFHNSKAAAFILIKFCLIYPGINLSLILELLALYFFRVCPIYHMLSCLENAEIV